MSKNACVARTHAGHAASRDVRPTRFDRLTFRTFGHWPRCLGAATPVPRLCSHPRQGIRRARRTWESWIGAADTDRDSAPLQLEVVSPQAANGAAATVVSHGASVTWRTP
jgi:hypothetical protein